MREIPAKVKQKEYTAVRNSMAAKAYLSIRQFANYVGMSYPTALKICRLGQARTITIGSHIKVTIEEANRFRTEGNYQPSTLKEL